LRCLHLSQRWDIGCAGRQQQDVASLRALSLPPLCGRPFFLTSPLRMYMSGTNAHFFYIRVCATATNLPPCSAMSAAVEVTPATAAAPAAAASPSADSSAAPSSAASAPSSLAAAPRPHGSALVSRTVALSGDQSAYLALMTERYKLGSIDKTARCLVNYADKDGDHRFIFENIRCRKSVTCSTEEG
jgi:hypothetical protein